MVRVTGLDVNRHKLRYKIIGNNTAKSFCFYNNNTDLLL